MKMKPQINTDVDAKQLAEGYTDKLSICCRVYKLYFLESGIIGKSVILWKITAATASVVPNNKSGLLPEVYF
ncbi:hypothetical protein NIES4074_51130 [Cylindrospermum sp. NIES-4074]|nr:hypothetical protein NIES4074_51130 [Cylindrospermum sp. NIES-4074]